MKLVGISLSLHITSGKLYFRWLKKPFAGKSLVVAGDMAVLDRAANVPGLTEVERRRVELRRIVCEHARRTHEFLLARDAKSKDEFGRLAMDLLDYRINIHKRLSDVWGIVFRAYKCEVWWWRKVPRHIITKAYPEMELND